MVLSFHAWFGSDHSYGYMYIFHPGRNRESYYLQLHSQGHAYCIYWKVHPFRTLPTMYFLSYCSLILKTSPHPPVSNYHTTATTVYLHLQRLRDRVSLVPKCQSHHSERKSHLCSNRWLMKGKVMREPVSHKWCRLVYNYYIFRVTLDRYLPGDMKVL